MEDSPIWADAGPAGAHEVVLFRAAFTLPEPLSDPKLELFADTRYDAWIDGVWVGRGPARFSRLTREYDAYRIGALAAGPHLIAVRVQWAPNIRRSESTRPFLQGHLQGTTSQGSTIATRTGLQWRALRSAAWREDAAPVHSWGLLGPTELLDFRALPPDWVQPHFADVAWPGAVVVTPPQAFYQPSSLPPLANDPIAATVKEVGVLSPGRAIGEVAPSQAPPNIAVQILAPTTLTVETLATPELASTAPIGLDGAPLAWRASADRPDVMRASQEVAPGTHQLSFTPSSRGLSFSVSESETADLVLPFQQGTHAGRRLLLAEPVSQAAAVQVTNGAGIALSFTQTPAYAVLDLGRVVHGRVVANVRGPAGTIVDMGWDERLWQNRRPLPYPGSLHPEWNQTDSWVLDGSTRELTTIDARAGRYVLIAAWGPGTVELSGLQVYEEHFPAVQSGSFASSDPQLDRIWQVGVDTLRPNMTDAYADPWRERGQWWGDAYIDDHVNQVLSSDTQVLARGIWLMAEAITNGRPNALSPNGAGVHSLDYAMLWVQSVHDYRRLTGDTQLLAQVYPALSSFIGYLGQYEHATTGLLDIPYGSWAQTVYIDSFASFNRYGQSTAVNAHYYGTLLDAADIADALGDPARGQLWRQKAAALRAKINIYLYRPAEGHYLTTIFQGQAYAPSPYAQAWALAYDIVPAQDRQRVADRLLAQLSADPSAPNLQIFGMFWVLEGLGRANRIPDAISIIKRYYGYMLDRGATTWWEHFNADQVYTASLSHGWGASPTWFLTTYVLGARRTGVRTWSLRPALHDLGQVSGALPLRTGALQVSWRTLSCSETALTLSAPGNTRGDLVVPFDGDTTIVALNGTVVWRNGRALADGVSVRPGGVRLALPGGQYELVVRHRCV
jgi:alpha-L-rhamnosidase